MENMWVLVYRDTIKEHDEVENLAEVQTTKEIVEQYLKECKQGIFKDMEEFLNEYIADDTQDFYEYAMKHNAVLAVENW